MNMEMYKIYLIIIPVIVVIYVIFTVITRMRISKMQDSGDLDKPFIEEFGKYLQEGETLKHYVNASWRESLSLEKNNYYLGLTDKRLLLAKINSATDSSRNSLEVAEEYANIKNIKIQNIKIQYIGNMQADWYPARQIEFEANGRSYLVKVSIEGSYRKNHAEELENICRILNNAGA
jgi:hypothetical protein